MPPKGKAAAAPVPEPAAPEIEEPPQPTEEELAAAAEAERLEAEKKAMRDPLRFYVGHVYEDVFRDLYREPKKQQEKVEGEYEEGEGEDGADEGQMAAAAGENGPDFSEEDNEIARIEEYLRGEQDRVGGLASHLQGKHDEAISMDIQEADYFQKNWGLVMREQIPVNESKLRTLLDRHRLDSENLHVPSDMMKDVERDIAIKTGTIKQHENMYALSKPAEPHYLKSTALHQLRYDTRNIQQTLSVDEKTLLADKQADRAAKIPPKPKTLSMEEKDKNREMNKKMQSKVSFLKNPRFVTDRTLAQRGGACPFFMSPDSVVFRDYEVGGVYEVMVEFRNTTGVGRRLQVLPCNNPSFSISSLQYDRECGAPKGSREPSSIVAPGMAAHLTVRFAPSHLNNLDDELVVATEFGDFKLPLLARRVQPRLIFTNPVKCGCILAGETIARVARVTNQGGEGSFRLIAADPASETYYETTNEGETTLISNGYRVKPACFYLDATESAELSINFTTPDVGRHSCQLLVECDNGVRTPLTLESITDALRLELTHWPSLRGPVQPPRSIEPGTSPWSVVPWQLNWLKPGAQVGSEATQEITIANGGNLQAQVHWRLASVPKPMLSWLAVGGRQRLTEQLVAGIHEWRVFRPDRHGQEDCPFEVTPIAATIEPHTAVTFRFKFRAHAPVGRRATTFAYLVASDLPVPGHCLLHLERLLQLQKAMPHEGYTPGLPLFGGAAEGGVLFEKNPVPQIDPDTGQPETEVRDQRGSCTVTCVCLQGLSTAPTVSCVPHVIALAGDTLPYLTHSREFFLRNTGMSPAYFRVRTTSRKSPEEFSPEEYDALWIISKDEAGPVPNIQEPDFDGEAKEVWCCAERLRLMWPPLPPNGHAMATLPGFGALATVVVEPADGRIPAGGSVSVRVTLRADREMDLEGSFLIDLPVDPAGGLAVTPPLKVSLLAAVRSPRVEVRHTGFLDYGVVRAHARHRQKLQVDNPSELPMLVRLQQRRDGTDDSQANSYVDSMVSQRGLVGAALQAASGGLLQHPNTPRMLGTPRLPVATQATPRKCSKTAENGTTSGVSAASATSRPWTEDDINETSFPMSTHKQVVDFFTRAVMRTRNYDGPAEVQVEGTVEPRVEPWVNARSGCVDTSGRRPYKYDRKQLGTTGRLRLSKISEDSEAETAVWVSNDTDLVFSPPCFILWPKSSTEVVVTYRADHPTKFRGLIEANSFDSMFPQCVQVLAEVQLPRLRLSSQHAHFPVTYTRTLSKGVDIQLYNESDMPASYTMLVPLKMEAGIEVQIDPLQGDVEARGEVTLHVFVIPTRQEPHAEQTVQVCVGDIIQPLELKVSANVFGVEVDYAVGPVGTLPPRVEPVPRKLEEPPSNGLTAPVTTGRAPRNAPTIDFGEMQLLSSKSLQVVLYNRSGIPAPFSLSVAKYKAHDPQTKGKKIGGLLDAATKMYCLRPRAGAGDGDPNHALVPETFANEPLPAAAGKLPEELPMATASRTNASTRKAGTSGNVGAKSRTASGTAKAGKSDTKGRRVPPADASTSKKPAKGRRFLLDDKHEAQAFRSSFGGEFAKQKEQHQQSTIALKDGRGYAVRVEPASDWMLPFSTSVITLTCYSDLPGTMEDDLIVKVPHLPGHDDDGFFRIPMKLTSLGNPLSLPEQQVGLCITEDPPRLLCGTIVPSEMQAFRRFKVANSSAAPMKITWKVFPKVQLESMKSERQFLNIALCRKGDMDPFEDVADLALDMQDAPLAIGLDGADADGGSPDAAEEERPYGFNLWAGEPPPVKDPLALQDTGDMPMRVEPEQGIVPIHGTATFTVTLTASKAMPTAAGHYHYVLVGKGRFTEDREAYLAQLEAGEPEVKPMEQTRISSKEEQVSNLPKIQLDEDDLMDDDSDIEAPPRGTKPGSERSSSIAGGSQTVLRRALTKEGMEGADLTMNLPGEPDKDVISTIVIDCIGDCIVPRLTIDKKGNPDVEEFQTQGAEGDEQGQPTNCPVFKFIHSTVNPVHVDMQGPKSRGLGMKLGAPPGGAPIAGVASYMMREVTMMNSNACVVSCRFRLQGPFQFREITQVGRHPVRPPQSNAGRTRKKGTPQEDPPTQPPTELFKVAKLETISLQVEFVPDLVPSAWWTDHKAEHVFRGDLIIEYPSDVTKDAGEVPTDLQRVHLVAVSRRPAVKVTLIPNHLDMPKKAELAHQPPWSGKPAVLVDFGFVHVNNSITRSRRIILSNETNVVARWQILHVGRKRRGAHDMGNAAHEDADFRALDDKDSFNFDVSDGELFGPSKGGIALASGDKERIPHLFPKPHPLHTNYREHPDEHRYEPQTIRIDFKPTKNELYMCRFRVQVEKGLSVDFICRGCGSYDEEDDPALQQLLPEDPPPPPPAEEEAAVQPEEPTQ